MNTVPFTKCSWHRNNIYICLKHFTFQVTLYPGDLVYIPKGWWHHVRSFGCPNIGVAIWFHVFANETEPDDNEEVFGKFLLILSIFIMLFYSVFGIVRSSCTYLCYGNICSIY